MKPGVEYRKLVDEAEKIEEQLERAAPSRLAFLRDQLAGLQPRIERARSRMKASDNLAPLRVLAVTDPTVLGALFDALEAAELYEELAERISAEIERIQALPKAKRRPFFGELNLLVRWFNKAQERVARG